MAKRIFKYELPTEDEVEVEMPIGAVVVSVAAQHDNLCMWAIVEDSVATEIRKFAIRGTGHDLNGVLDADFIGTVVMYGGSLVWHVFERK